MRLKDLKIVVISGRALAEIKSLVGLKGIVYAGNHGLEIDGPKLRWRVNISEQYKAALKSIKDDLNKHISFIKGVFVEDKGLSLGFHYRLADKKDIPLAKGVFHSDTVLRLIGKKIKVAAGKMVLEVRPPLEWDKGGAVLWLLARQAFAAKKQVLPVYVGDDKTDEDAFNALKGRGLSIFVGGPRRRSGAEYYLKSADEVLEFLRQILALRKNDRLCRN